MIVSHIQTPQVQGSVIGVGGRWYLVKCGAIWTSGAGLLLHGISILLVHTFGLEGLRTWWLWNWASG